MPRARPARPRPRAPPAQGAAHASRGPGRTGVQIFATSRRRCVSLIVPRPLCAGATSDYVGVMPARSRKSLARLADHAASKDSKQGSEASPASAGDGVERGASSTVRRPAHSTSPAAIDPALPPPRRADTRRSVEDGGERQGKDDCLECVICSGMLGCSGCVRCSGMLGCLRCVRCSGMCGFKAKVF